MSFITRFTVLLSMAAGVISHAEPAEQHVPLDASCSGYYMVERPGHNTTMLCIWLSDPLSKEDKCKFWDNLRKKSPDGKSLPIIYQVKFKSPKGWKYKIPPFEDAQRQLDAWFASDDTCRTSPELIRAITLNEENITWDGQSELLDQIGEYARKTYGLTVYQFLSEPLLPVSGIRADGWALDAYHVPTSRFRSHLEAFALTGKPVFPILWGSGHFDGYHSNMDFAQLTEFTKARIDACRSLNMPVVLFCVSQIPWGSALQWFKPAEDPAEEKYREAIRAYLLAMRTEKLSGYTAPPKSFPLIQNLHGKGTGSIDGKMFSLAYTTQFDSVYNWVMTVDGVKLKGKSGKLSWHFVPNGSIDNGVFTFEYVLGGESKATIRASSGESIQLSPHKKTESISLNHFKEVTLSIEAEGDFVFQNLNASYNGTLPHVPRILEKGDKGIYNATSGLAENEFYASLSECSDSQNCVQVGIERLALIPGTENRTDARIVQHLQLPGKKGRLEVTANGRVFDRELFGKLKLILTLDGKTPIATVVNDPEKIKQTMTMQAQIPADVRDVYMIWELAVSGKVNDRNRRPVEVNSCNFVFTPEE